MYESLTALLPEMDRNDFGEWAVDREGDGTMEHPFHLPFMIYSPSVSKLEEAVYSFVEQHREMRLTRYGEILGEAGLRWETESMRKADVSALDGRTVMALLVGAFRAERFCDGAVLDFCKDGSIAKWLKRLREIDAGPAE